MKKTLLVIMALVMALTLVFGLFSTASAAATPATTPQCLSAINNGAYMILTGKPTAGHLEFDYGWTELNKFASPPVGYYLGLYYNTGSTYWWASDQQFDGLITNGTITFGKITSLNLIYEQTSTLPSGSYSLNFFVRGSYASTPPTNVAAVTLNFSIP
jgi:hypothetical protein